MFNVCFVILFLLTAATACGGSGDSTTGETTSNETKVTAAAASTESVNATTAATSNALQGTMLNIAAQSKSPGITKSTEIVDVNYTYSCPIGGNAYATGTLTLACSYEETSGSCTVADNTLQVEMQDCQATETVNETNYTVTLNGTITTDVSGSGSGNLSGLTSLSFSGSLNGTADSSGDVTGTVDLDNISYEGNGVPPTITCSGTATVTTDEATQVCSISSDCSTCEE